MDGWLKALVAAACVVVIAGGGYYGWTEYKAAELARQEQRAANDPAILVCEAIAKARLKSPSSYKRVSATVSGLQVRISYDAANSYNALLRGNHECDFKLDDDGQHFSFRKSGDLDAATKETSRLAEEIKAAKVDGSYTRRKREFDRKLVDQMDEAVNSIGRALLDSQTAKNTGLQPIPVTQTALRAAE